VVAGWVLVLIAYIGFIFGALAITFKYISESVTDTIMKRLYPPAAPPQSQTQPPPQNPPAR